MTEEIDLDELDVASDDEETPNRGDWFWRDEGDPAAEPAGEDGAGGLVSEDEATSEDATAGAESDAGEADADRSDSPMPHVPWEDKNKPVGIPKEVGGAGGEAASGGEGAEADHGGGTGTTASGPHGGGADDMTLALTYRAMKRVAEPLLVVQGAQSWADWVGIVGDVDAHVINKFQRNHNIDVGFFSGSGQSATDRLQDIDKHSMFYAERMVVVGLPDEEVFAEEADWEFIPLSEAAEKAGWELTDDG